MTSPAFRVRSTGELLDASFLLYRRHFVSIVLAAGAFMLPAAALGLLLPQSVALLVRIVSNLLYMFASAAVILVASEAYLGRKVEVGTILRTVLGRSGPVLWASFVQGILVGLGLLLLVVPGVIVLIWTFAMVEVVIIEGCGADEAFNRSRDLARGGTGRIVLTTLLSYLIFFLVMLGAGFIIGMLYALGFSEAQGKLLTTLVMMCVFPFTAVAGTLLYYDARIRNEGLDLDLLAGELEAAPAGTVVAVAPV